MAVKKDVDRKERLIRPRCRVLEEKTGDISLHVEMPGVKNDDLHIDVENGVLSISAKRKEAAKPRKITISAT